MAITLNHTIVPAHDKVESAAFYSRLFGFEQAGEFSRFIVVRVNDTLSLDFDTREKFDTQHYAFKVTDDEFESIFGRVKEEGLHYGSGPGPEHLYDMQVDHRRGGKRVYFDELNGHSIEIFTA